MPDALRKTWLALVAFVDWLCTPASKFQAWVWSWKVPAWVRVGVLTAVLVGIVAFDAWMLERS